MTLARPWPASWAARSASPLGLFLKKLVADVLDRIDQFDDFDPTQHYQLTVNTSEMTAVEREAQATERGRHRA